MIPEIAYSAKFVIATYQWADSNCEKENTKVIENSFRVTSTKFVQKLRELTKGNICSIRKKIGSYSVI